VDSLPDLGSEVPDAIPSSQFGQNPAVDGTRLSSELGKVIDGEEEEWHPTSVTLLLAL